MANRSYRRRRSSVLVLVLLLAAVAACCGWLLFQAYYPGEATPTEPPVQTDPVTPAATDPATEAATQAQVEIPASLLELMEKNPETAEFVMNYPNHLERPFDITTINRTAGIPLFLQWDQRWGYEVYGTDVLALTGCGPTCMAMAGYYLTGESRFSPDQMAQFATENNYYSWGNGTKWTFFTYGAEALGLQSKELILMESVIVEQVQAGHPVVINVGPGDFTEHGHFLIISGYEDGMFRVNDPNSIIRSETLWSYETLEPQIRNIWALWV